MSGSNDLTARPTDEQRREIGRRAAANLTLTPADLADRSNVTDEAGLYDLITHQASTRTWSEILGADYEQIAGGGIPASVLDAGMAKGYSRATVGRLVHEAADSVFHGETPDAEPGRGEAIPDGTLVEWTGTDTYGTSLAAGSLIRVLSSRESRDAQDDWAYSVTGSGDRNAPDGERMFTVRSRHIKRPEITSGPEQRAFTTAPALYSSAVEVGTLVGVRSGPDGDGDFYCRTVDSQTTCYLKADGLEPWTPARQRVEDEKAAQREADTVAVAEMTEQVVEDQPEVRSLRATVERQRAQIAELHRWRSQAESDMATASERLIDESNRRNWCSEYDQIIEDINGRMSVLSFADRQQEVEMDAEIEAEVTLDLQGYAFTGTVTLTISYEGLPDEDPCDNDYITDDTVEQRVADCLGVSYRSVDVDSWSVESYDRA